MIVCEADPLARFWNHRGYAGRNHSKHSINHGILPSITQDHTMWYHLRQKGVFANGDQVHSFHVVKAPKGETSSLNSLP